MMPPLSIKEAVEKAGVSETTIRRWVKRGILKAVQPSGRKGLILIPEAELQKVLSPK